MSKLRAPRISIVGFCVVAALLALFIGKRELTMIWFSAVFWALPVSYFLARYPWRRLSPGDLRNALNAEDAPDGMRTEFVDRSLASRSIRPFPELAIIAFVSFIVAGNGAVFASRLFGNDVEGCVIPCAALGTLCGLLAGREMLRWRTIEFILRVHQRPAWKLKLVEWGVIGGFVIAGIALEDRAGITKAHAARWYAPNETPPRLPLIERTYSPSGAIVLEVREDGRGMLALWARQREMLKPRVLVLTHARGITARMSNDERWLAVTDTPDRDENAINLFERGDGSETKPLSFSTPPDLLDEGLAARVKRFYSTATGDGARLRRGRASVTTAHWSKDKLMLKLTILDLPDSEQTEPWVCSYSPGSGVMEAVSPVKITDNGARRKAREETCVQMVRDVIRLQQERHLDDLMKHYGDAVSYYDQPAKVDQVFIKREKAKLFEDWPEAKVEIIGQITMRTGSPDSNELAQMRTHFTARNPAKNTTSEGDERIEYSIQLTDGVPKIIGEKSTLERRSKVPQKEMAESPAPARETESSYRGERFPETRRRLLSESDFGGWSADKLRYALNEMVARHGAEFPQPELTKWFQQFEWYRSAPKVSIDTVEREKFSDIERRNMELLGALRDKMKGRP